MVSSYLTVSALLRDFILYSSPIICIDISGARATIATTPKASVTTFPPTAIHAPIDNGSKKVEDLKNRCALISKSKPDCVVSVHQNSYQDAAIRGAQTFYYADSAEGKRLAQLIQQQLISHVAPDNHREAKGNKSYYLLKKTDAPIVIAECGFLSNPEEEKLLKTAEYQEKTAWAIYMGVMAFLNAG